MVILPGFGISFSGVFSFFGSMWLGDTAVGGRQGTVLNVCKSHLSDPGPSKSLQHPWTVVPTLIPLVYTITTTMLYNYYSLILEAGMPIFTTHHGELRFWGVHR